jgi:CRISPR-associated protein Cas2
MPTVLLQDPRKAGKPHLVIYDISEDRARSKVSELLKDYGLTRVQWSAFMGRLTRASREELQDRLERALGDQPAAITMIELNPEHVQNLWFRGRP